jgi:hypothetical protein
LCCITSYKDKDDVNPIQKQLQELIVQKAVTIKQIRTFAQKNHGDFHSHSFSKVIHAINTPSKGEGTRIYEQTATIFLEGHF